MLKLRLSALSYVQRRHLVAGKATPEMTKWFIERANLPMFHRFEKTSLFVNPIIHGMIDNTLEFIELF